MGLLLPAVAALVAVLILPGWSFYFDVIPKVTVVLIGAALVLWRPRMTASKWFLGILGAQALALIIAAGASTHRWFSLYGSTWRRSGVLAELAVFILAGVAAGSFGGDRRWLRVMVLPGLAVAIYAVFQYFGMDPLMDPAGYRFGEGRFMIVRPPGTFGHAAYLATYLLFIVFAGARLARRETAAAWRWAALAAAVAGGFAIVLSGTRAAILGLIVGAVFVAVRDRVKWNLKWASGTAGLVILVLGAFYISPAGERLRARAFWSSEDRWGGARLMLWRDSAKMSAGRWLTGYGPEMFSMEFPRHESMELARAYPDFYHESPHNIFLDALVSKGVLGLAGLVGMVLLGLKMARGGLGGAFVAMLVSQQFTTFTIPTELYFYLCVSMLIGEAGVLAVRPVWGWRLLAIPLAGFAVYLAGGDALLGAGRRAIDRGDAASAAKLVERARQWGASADIYFSRRFLAAKMWPAASEAAVKAPETADDPQNALVNLAAFRGAVNDAAGAELSLRQAIAVSPNWYKPRWLLAQVLELEGRIGEAKVEAQAAEDRDGGKHEEVRQTLDRIRSR